MFFRWPFDGDSPSVGGLDRLKLDVKGAGELCTLPPSTSASGHRYHWRDRESPQDVPLAPVPDAFAEYVARVADTRRTRRAPTQDLTTLEGALSLAHRRAGYASRTSNGAGRGAAGLRRALAEAGAAAPVVTAALDAFTAAAGL